MTSTGERRCEQGQACLRRSLRPPSFRQSLRRAGRRKSPPSVPAPAREQLAAKTLLLASPAVAATIRALQMEGAARHWTFTVGVTAVSGRTLETLTGERAMPPRVLAALPAITAQAERVMQAYSQALVDKGIVLPKSPCGAGASAWDWRTRGKVTSAKRRPAATAGHSPRRARRERAADGRLVGARTLPSSRCWTAPAPAAAAAATPSTRCPGCGQRRSRRRRTTPMHGTQSACKASAGATTSCSPSAASTAPRTGSAHPGHQGRDVQVRPDVGRHLGQLGAAELHRRRLQRAEQGRCPTTPSC